MNIKRIKENVYIQTILIFANYLFLIDFVIPVTFGKNEFKWFNINILNDFISEYFPWFHACLFILSLFLGNMKKYKHILLPICLINLIAIIPGMVIAVIYLLAGLFG